MKRQRAYIPGETWVYYKLYTGIKTSDILLMKVIYPVVRELLYKGLIRSYFFIRYTDPDFHLRVRFLLKDECFTGEVMAVVKQHLRKFVNSGEVWKVQLDTYVRELERYHPLLIELSEWLFYYDSECVIQLLRRIEKEHHEEYRWMIALSLIDLLFDDFKFRIEDRSEIMIKMSDSYKKEFGFNMYNAKQFNTKYRQNRLIIESVLANTISDKRFGILYNCVLKRSKDICPIVSDIQRICNRYKINIQDLLHSYVHISLNRLFRSRNRIHELVLYDFMKRYYNGMLARKDA